MSAAKQILQKLLVLAKLILFSVPFLLLGLPFSGIRKIAAAEGADLFIQRCDLVFNFNLDVDNLIFLSKDESGFKIRSGALEYECPEYNILDIVAQNIDGGLDSIRKRWKRYEKTAVL